VALTHYLKSTLSQDEKKGIGRGYVLIQEDGVDVQGFYTLSSFNVNLDEGDLDDYQKQTEAKGFSKISPKMPVPSVLIGRLARHQELKGTEAGDMLLVDALQRILNFSKEFGVHFVVVDAKNDFAKRFYRKFGFLEFGSVKNRMYLPVKSIER
jgi:ribosomal protein S18 acetylase RimI-like enzyme